MAHNLAATARALVAPGKGILAADESSGTIKKRFDTIDVPSTEDNRRAYRELLFTTEGMADYVSGVILFDETIRQSASDGAPFVAVLAKQGVMPGIKVDKGAKDLAGAPGEKVTEGLDGLRDRLAEYANLGARFTKWRAVITIGDDIPSATCLDANAHALARYAALSQEAGLVPIVEPEVLMDGDHSIERCAEVTETTLVRTFEALRRQRVSLEGMLLKPNMVLPGKDHRPTADVEAVADATLGVLRRAVPAAVPGIVFLSGGQSDREATAHLDAMNRIIGEDDVFPWPWRLSFSYGRALQAPPLKTWAGKAENVAAAKRAFLHRARLNGAATSGAYSADMEKDAA